MKYRTRKFINFVFIVGFTALFALSIFLLVRPASYYDTDSSSFQTRSQSSTEKLFATVSIDYSAVYKDENYSKLSDNLKISGSLAESGFFTNNFSLELDDGSNVLDALILCCEINGLEFDYETAEQNAYHTAYVKGIGGLYEGDCTKSSGWVYTVDGEQPTVGMSDFKLSGGENIVVKFVVF